MDKFYCGNCGFPNLVENKFCNNCGSKLVQSVVDVTTSAENIIEFKSETKNNYENLSENLNRLIRKSGYFTIICNERYVQFLRLEDERKIHVAIINVDSTENEILLKIGPLEFEPVEENLIRSFDITSPKKTISEVVAITKKIFEDVYSIDPNEAFVYETPEPEKIDKYNEVAKKNQPKPSYLGLGIFLIIVILIVGYCLHNENSKRSNNGKNITEQETVSNSPYDASVYQVEDYLKKEYLKDPDSYESIGWSKVIIDTGYNYRYIVRHKYRAKNGFGGYDVENKIFYLDKDGNVVNVKDFNQ